MGLCLHRLRKLQGLFMHHNDLGDAGVSAFAEAFKQGAAPKLKRLGLCQVGLGSDGMKSLMAAAESGGLARLQMLFVLRNQIEATGAEAFARAISLDRFASLNRINVDASYHVDSLLNACSKHGVRIDGIDTL